MRVWQWLGRSEVDFDEPLDVLFVDQRSLALT